MYADREAPPPPRIFKTSEPETVRVLGVRVDFNDASMDSTPVYFGRLLTFLGQYYQRVSHGKIVFVPAVTESIYRMPMPMGYYGDENAGAMRGVSLIWDAVRAADQDYDFAHYQGIAIIHAKAGEESDINGDSTYQIWSAFYPDFLVSQAMSDTLKREVPGVPTHDLDAAGDTVFIKKSVIIPETEDQDGYRFGAVGVYCHEHGHFFGLPDLYNTIATDGSVQGIGNWGIMATGTWNGNGWVPAEQDAWSRVFLGWVDPVDVLADADVTLPPVEEAGHDTSIVRIPLAGDESFLIENRVQDLNGDGRFNFEDVNGDSIFDFYTDSYKDAEFDFYLPGEGKGSGLLIWHIDQSVIDYALYYNVVEGDSKHQGIGLKEADGIQDLQGPVITYESFGSKDDSYREGNNTALTPDTDPNSRPSFGGPSDVYVTNVGPAGSRMSFSVRFAGSTLAGWPVDVDAPLVGNPVAAQFGGEDGLEIVAADKAGRLHAWDAQGRPLFAPVETGARFLREPLVGPVDAAQTTGIVALGAEGRVYVRRADGSQVGPAEGWALPSGALSDSAVAALYANGLPSAHSDVVVGSRFADRDSTYSILSVLDLDTGAADTLHLPGTSTRAPAIFPATGPVPVERAASGDLSRIAIVAVNAKSGKGRYYLISSTGSGLRAKPLGIGFDAPVSAPVLGDLDRDGVLDLVGISGNGYVHALRLGAEGDSVKATELPGWPLAFDVVDSSDVSLADVDGNGYLDVLAVGTGGRAIAINQHGVMIHGWPQTLEQSLEFVYEIPKYPAPLAADLDGGADHDPAEDMIAVLGDGRAIPLAADKRQRPGWPILSTPGSVPVLADVNGDGVLDAVAFEQYGEAGRVRVREAPGKPAAVSGGWLSYRHDPAHTGRNDGGTQTPVPHTGAPVTEFFMQPNPVPAAGGAVHYIPGPGVTHVEIEIYDLAGDLVRHLAGSTFLSSDNLVRWDGLDAKGSPVASGLYLCRLSARSASGETMRVLKFAVLR